MQYSLGFYKVKLISFEHQNAVLSTIKNLFKVVADHTL